MAAHLTTRVGDRAVGTGHVRPFNTGQVRASQVHDQEIHLLEIRALEIRVLLQRKANVNAGLAL